MSDLRKDAHSISRLMGDGVEQLSHLLQVEIRLARAELAEKATQAGLGVGLLFAGALLAIPALVLFLFALAVFMTERGMSPALAHLIAGAVGAILSAVFIVVGMGHLKPSNLTPDATIYQVKQDVAAAKEMTR